LPSKKQLQDFVSVSKKCLKLLQYFTGKLAHQADVFDSSIFLIAYFTFMAQQLNISSGLKSHFRTNNF